jgi:hypothetical protein
MRPVEEIEKLIKNVPIRTSVQKDDKVLDEVLSAMDRSRKMQLVASQPSLWRIILKSKASKFAAAIIVIGVVLSFWRLERYETRYSSRRIDSANGGSKGNSNDV